VSPPPERAISHSIMINPERYGDDDDGNDDFSMKTSEYYGDDTIAIEKIILSKTNTIKNIYFETEAKSPCDDSNRATLTKGTMISTIDDKEFRRRCMPENERSNCCFKGNGCSIF
jgi:hypothetical protein